jgi:hypothetical protein
VLVKNGEPFARLVPDNEKVCGGRDLAQALAETDLPKDEARRGAVSCELLAEPQASG